MQSTCLAEHDDVQVSNNDNRAGPNESRRSIHRERLVDLEAEIYRLCGLDVAGIPDDDLWQIYHMIDRIIQSYVDASETEWIAYYEVEQL